MASDSQNHREIARSLDIISCPVDWPWLNFCLRLPIEMGQAAN